MRRVIRAYVMSKIVGFMLVGTCWAAGAQDRIDLFVHAIARAEGFYQYGSIPNRCHNPGDLKGTRFPGEVGLCRGGHARFRNDAAGWAALRHQIEKSLAGESTFYRQDMTLAQVARRYAANSALWARNVARNLGVTPSTTLQEYFELAPKVTYAGIDMRTSAGTFVF